MRRLLLMTAALFILTDATAAEGAQRGFSFLLKDVVVFTGGANVVAEQEHGYLEVLLNAGRPDLNLRFRNLGWEGDTVYEQRRDLNFGPWAQQFRKAGATVILAQFGQMESLQGRASLPRFVYAYEKLLDEFSKRTERIVLVSPFPFEKAPPPLPDLSPRNDDLQEFVDAIGRIAQQRGWFFVDLLHPLRRSATDYPLTTNGVQLTAHGQWLIACELSKQLGFEMPPKAVRFDSRTGAVAPASAERLRQSVLAKNRLWFDYWRPMNWAFLAGDRTEQPSSHDHRDPQVRWFPGEMEKFIPLIEAKEREIGDLARRFP